MPRHSKTQPQTKEEMIEVLEKKRETKVYKNTRNAGNSRTENITELLNGAIKEFEASTHKERITLSDTESVKEQTFEYLGVCAEQGVLPDMQGLALSLGHTARNIYAYKKSKPESDTAIFLEMCGDLFSSLISAAANNGDINNIFAIFTQKAQHGWKETTEIILTPNNPLGDVKSEDELKRLADKYSKDAIEVESRGVKE